VLIQFVCDVGSELFRKDADAEQKHSSVQDDLMKARQALCSLTDKVKLHYIFKVNRILTCQQLSPFHSVLA
jgi:hypothetical protein